MSTKFTRKSKIGGLCITRAIGEAVLVNNGEIRIEVVDIKGKYVRLGFKAAQEISVDREERLVPKSPPSDGEKKP